LRLERWAGHMEILAVRMILPRHWRAQLWKTASGPPQQPCLTCPATPVLQSHLCLRCSPGRNRLWVLLTCCVSVGWVPGFTFKRRSPGGSSLVRPLHYGVEIR
jgi:hypothetical protein